MSAVDPVCGSTVNPNLAAGEAEFRGRKYYFCSAACQEKFSRDPSLFVEQEAALQPPADMQ